MQESFVDTINNLEKGRVKVEELEIILGSTLEEIVGLCKRAYLKPKTDDIGNAYFTSEDVDILRKIKSLYNQSKQTQSKVSNESVQENTLETAKGVNVPLNNPGNKINFLTKAKNRLKEIPAVPSSIQPYGSYQIKTAMDNLENSLIAKFTDILSEKMDGFDEIIVELIRSKTENENLRQQVNTLKKQLFILKKELSSYSPLALNLYIKKDAD